MKQRKQNFDIIAAINQSLEASLGGKMDCAKQPITANNDLILKLALERLAQLKQLKEQSKQEEIDENKTCQKHGENMLSWLSAT